MPIYIYNSLSRKKEKFKPLKQGRVRMYVCGPTVYDDSHIGHARGAFVFDVVRNYFRHKDFKVKYVRNITDVDDKIIEKARQIAGDTGDLKKTAREVAGRYLKGYNDDMRALGIGEPDAAPRATEHIDDMIDMIKVLLRKKYAYYSGGDIYFRVKKFKGYGKLSHQSMEMMESGASARNPGNKEDPLDFALWKKSKEREPVWKTGGLEGRPGWHIECSAMSLRHLGGTFDIHGGGIDLIFPHHENEIAQAEACGGKKFAKYWMHNGLLTVNGQKMAKSLGNYVRIPDFLGRYGDPDILKIFFLSSHYRSPVDFTEKNIKAAEEAKKRFTVFFDKAAGLGRAAPLVSLKGAKAARFRRALKAVEKEFEKAMDDDFNTAMALGALFNAVKTGNSALDSEGMASGDKAAFISALASAIKKLGAVLGLSFRGKSIPQALAAAVEEKIKARDEARRAKDYKKADDIRGEIQSLGVVIEDTPGGTKWRMR